MPVAKLKSRRCVLVAPFSPKGCLPTLEIFTFEVGLDFTQSIPLASAQVMAWHVPTAQRGCAKTDSPRKIPEREVWLRLGEIALQEAQSRFPSFGRCGHRRLNDCLEPGHG